ncbi:hypothetical protein SK355_12500 [Candidatus Fukatsuia symbiotica]|uniref:hypothetical protein n=1 Tax=Candidatus Fukatsuia TaxID=1927833 RepID=UPI0013C2E1F8|nr:hypothetical protein [Candidatus Fukatsuia symbiotica]MEA9445989.1 hypothetical protein [Candidatus Fukatsuia symbiotica]
MSHSVDFRRKVLGIREKENLSIRETAKRFHIGSASVTRWLSRIIPRTSILSNTNGLKPKHFVESNNVTLTLCFLMTLFESIYKAPAI